MFEVPRINLAVYIPGNLSMEELSQLQGCREFRVAETLITLLKVIKLIRLVMISTLNRSFVLFFPFPQRFAQNLGFFWQKPYKTWRLFTGEEPRWFRVPPRQDMVSYFQNVPARDSTVHIRADPWPRYTMKDRVPCGPFGWFVKGIVRYWVVVSNVFFELFWSRFGE